MRQRPSPRVQVLCNACGSRFAAFQAEIRRGGARYCSRKCYRSTLKGNHYAATWDWKSGYGRCSKCRQVLPISQFYNDSSRSTGIDAYCKVCAQLHVKSAALKLRTEVLSHYSNGEPKCACCGETIFEFLTIDHVLGNGNKHRKSLGGHGSTWFYAWLRRNGYPEEYRVLCMNCNWAAGLYGGHCPHQVARAASPNL